MLHNARLGLRLVVFAVVAAVLLEAAPVVQSADSRAPIPARGVELADLRMVRSMFAEEFIEATTAVEQIALAQQLMREAERSKELRFALLREAWELGIKAGDLSVAKQAARAISDGYQIDPAKLEATTVDRTAKVARHPNQQQAVAEEAVALIDTFLRRDDFDGAVRLEAIAHAAAGKLQDDELLATVAAASEKVDRAAEWHAAVTPARKTLNRDPTNAAANLAVGRYYCFAVGDWPKGLLMLAGCSDGTLRAVALAELKPQKTPADQLALADRWWKLIDAHPKVPPEAARQRGAHWYHAAYLDLSKEDKARAKERLAAAGRRVPRSPAARHAFTPGGSEQFFANGGTRASHAAVEAGLRWLAAHQMPNGSWSFLQHTAPNCNGQCRNPGMHKEATRGATAMGLLPFLGAGHTHKTGEYKETVEAGLAYLSSAIKLDPLKGGSLYEGGGRMYSHGLGAMALCKAYAMTDDKALHNPSQSVISFICYAQDPLGGGWRYEPRQKGDTSVAGWQIMALKTGHGAFLHVPPIVVKKAFAFLDDVQANSGANYGYTGPGAGPATTAIGLLCRMHLGWKRDNPALQRGVEHLSKLGPSHSNLYYNYYATQVLYHWQGDMWEQWNKQMRDWLIETQVKGTTHEAGSWYVGGGHGKSGGRLYSTSMALMILEVYYSPLLPIDREEAGE